MSDTHQPTVYVGIDAGASRTTMKALSGGRTLGRAGRGCSVRRDGVDACARHLVREVEALIPIGSDQDIALCAGVAGAADDRLQRALAARLQTLLAGPAGRATIEVVSDQLTALDAAFGDGGGLAVIAGTGSSVAARTTDGTVFTAGGWGASIHDPGSGVTIGRAVLAAVADDLDGGPATALRRQLFDAFRLRGRADLLDLVYAGEFEPSSLAPIACEAAVRGDRVANEILEHEAEALARQAMRLVKRVGRTRPLPARVAVSGGLREAPSFRSLLSAALERSLPDWELTTPARSPAVAALERARRLVAD